MRRLLTAAVLLFCAALTSACESEIDKCVNAQLRAFDERFPSGIQPEYGYQKEQTRGEAEAKARLVCARVQHVTQ